MRRRKARIWSVFDKEGRLVLALSDEPGEFNFAKVPPEDSDPVLCAFATLQCYDQRGEPELLNLLFRARHLHDFLERLRQAGFRVQEGRPQPGKFARL